MTDDRADKARRRLRTIARAQRDEVAAILEALDAGVEQKDIAAELGCTRERVRLIVRKARPETARKVVVARERDPQTGEFHDVAPARHDDTAGHDDNPGQA